MDIAKELAKKSFDLFLPVPQYKRGKAHTYEWVFREAVDAIRKAPATSLEEIKTLSCGRLLKALDRRKQTRYKKDITGRRKDIVNPHFLPSEKFANLVADFIGLLIGEVLEKRANKSVATFNRLANSFADGIYYEIDRQVKEKWSAWQQEVAERKASQAKGGN